MNVLFISNKFENDCVKYLKKMFFAINLLIVINKRKS